MVDQERRVIVRTVLLVGSLFAVVSQAFEVRDPHGVLTLSDEFLGDRSYEGSVTTGDGVESVERHCVTSGACETHTSIDRVESKDDVGFWFVGESRVYVRREDYDAVRGNGLRENLRRLAIVCNECEVEFVASSRVPEGLRVDWTYRQPSTGNEGTGTMILAAGQPYIAQVVVGRSEIRRNGELRHSYEVTRTYKRLD